jgi:hypothetical protein
MAKLLNRSDAIIKALTARGEKLMPTKSARWKVLTRTFRAERVGGDLLETRMPKDYCWLVGKNGAMRVSRDGTIANSVACARKAMEALVAEGRAL